METQKDKSPLILIVDDNETNIEILETTLESEYRIGTAMNGKAALDYAEKHHPQLILLDILMPGMNGYEVIRRLQESPKTKDIAVIFITALDETENKIEGFELGAVDYITKPFMVSEVMVRVKTHLTLIDYRDRLEEKVLERTKELEAAHQRLQKMEGLLASLQTASILNNQIDQHLKNIIEYSKTNPHSAKTVSEVNSISTLINEIVNKVSQSYNKYAEMENDFPDNSPPDKEF
ncbi:response regulator [bacterium]|nr:response regulator [bacterium]